MVVRSRLGITVNEPKLFRLRYFTGGFVTSTAFGTTGAADGVVHETIETEVKSPYRFNPVEHVTASGRNFTLHNCTAKLVSSPFNTYEEYTGVQYGWNVAPDWLSISDTALLQTCYGKIKPFEPVFSLPNFVWELRELPDMITPFTRDPRYVDRSKRVSDGYLAYQFGYLPFIGDMKRLISIYSSFEKAYAKFVRENGVTLYARSSQKTVGGPETKIVAAASVPWSWGYKMRRADTMSQCTIKYRYDIIGATPPPTPALLLKWMGLRGDPRIIWNAMPWSFVVDWVWKVGEWLSQWDEGTIPFRLTILDACVSHKQRQTKTYLRIYSPSSAVVGLPSIDHTFGAVTWKRYSRYRVTPSDILSSNLLPQFDNLSLRELVLGGALANSKR